jgi:hypothetical protein
MKTGATLRAFFEKSITLGRKIFHFNIAKNRQKRHKELIFKKLAS